MRSTLLCLWLVLLGGCASQDKIGRSLNLVVEREGRSIAYDGVADESALETLRRLAVVETRTLSFGEFVVSINGISADGEQAFWAFTVNGEMSRSGAGDTLARSGDRFQWQYRERKKGP